MPLHINRLGHALGAEIVGADLTSELPKEEFAAIKAAWIEHQVIVVRDANISKDDQLRFARRFGLLEEVKTKRDDEADDKQYVLYISNRVVDGSKGALPDGEMFFHSDQCYYETPCQGTLLNAIELPSWGGETLFASMTRAYDSLSPQLKQRIAGLVAVNMYDYAADPTHRNPVFNPEAPHFAHPLATRHPETGKAVLFVNRQMTHHVEGLDPAESEELLLTLFDHAESPANVYEHSWRPHDLVMWDNRSVLHARKDFDPAEPRILRRITVKGARPVPAPNPNFA